MYDMAKFSWADMVDCGFSLCQLGVGTDTMESASHRIVKYFYEHLIDRETGEPACALIRCFKTHPYRDLDAELRQSTQSLLGNYVPSPAMKCLTLLATAGVKPEWNSREESVGHKAIPLVSKDMVTQFPMILQLIGQFGLEIGTVLEPHPDLLIEFEQKKLNVFHVPEALGSPYIPSQESFVIPFAIKSVLGFGGLLPSGNLFAIIMFSRLHITQTTAEIFKTLASNVKSVLLPFDGKAVFAMKRQQDSF